MTRSEILNRAWLLVLVVAVILMVADPERFFQVAASLGVAVVGPIAGARVERSGRPWRCPGNEDYGDAVVRVAHGRPHPFLFF